MDSFAFAPVGYVRAEHGEKRQVPRQPGAEGHAAIIEMLPRDGIHDALADLDGFDHVWVIFVFDRAETFAPKVHPPRSSKKRGLFATRSPHRPNPIGISAVRLARIDGRNLHIEGADMLDGTPVLDVKPYIGYADAIPDASLGWLAEEGERVRARQDGRPVDPIPKWNVVWDPRAREAAAWLDARGVPLTEDINRALALGPEPHAYRRIRKRNEGMELAVKEWRADFEVAGADIVIVRLRSGFRAKDLAEGGPELETHRAFIEAFGA